MPFGNQSFTPQNVGYLTSEQALADYAQLVRRKEKERERGVRNVINEEKERGGRGSGSMYS
jgi:hypothetical protein